MYGELEKLFSHYPCHAIRSAPADQLFKLFGFTDENVLEKAQALLAK